MKFAVHSLLWTERFDNEPERLVEKAKKLGFDGMEIYVSPQQLPSFDKARVKKALESADMDCVGSTCLTVETDVTSTDEAIRRRGISHLEASAELFSELGAKLVSGVTYVAWGKTVGRSRTEEEWKRAVESLKEVCRRISNFEIILGLEPVNRFETYFLNTATDAIRLAKEVGEPSIGVHLDTFHMNIEEKNYYDPIIKADKLLCHFHCCENDRGIAGTGNVNWDEVFRGLADIGYDNWITIESFTPEIKDVAASTAIWRQLAPSADALASESLRFLRSMQAKHLHKSH